MVAGHDRAQAARLPEPSIAPKKSEQRKGGDANIAAFHRSINRL